MTTAMPEGENVKKAVKWISANIEENKTQSMQQLIEKSVFKFDLSPNETEFLFGLFHQ